MYVIRRGKRGNFKYLAYDDSGRLRWSLNKLDAIRMTWDQAHDGFQSYLDGAGRLKPVGMDGHYEVFENTSLQVFKQGRFWKVRTCATESADCPWVVAPQIRKSAESALRYGRAIAKSAHSTV